MRSAHSCGLRAVERAHVDDEEVVALLGAQLVDRLLDAGLRGRVEHARAVGDPVGQPERRIGGRHPGTGEEEERDDDTQSDETGHSAPSCPEVQPSEHVAMPVAATPTDQVTARARRTTGTPSAW